MHTALRTWGQVLVAACAVGIAAAKELPAESHYSDEGATGLSGSYEISYNSVTIASPLFFWVGKADKNPLRYRLFTQTISLRLPISSVIGRSFWRGQWEFNAGVVGSIILHGPESYFVGIGPGFRYNFLPKGSAWSPFVELRGYVGQTNSSGIKFGQQQDLTFCYQLALGTKYQFSPRRSFQIAVVTQHISNAYLTRPNYGFDVVGLNLGFHQKF